MSDAYKQWAREQIALAKAGRIYGTPVTHDLLMLAYDVSVAESRVLAARTTTQGGV